MGRIIIDDILNRQMTVDTSELVRIIEDLYEDSPPDVVEVEEFIEWLKDY